MENVLLSDLIFLLIIVKRGEHVTENTWHIIYNTEQVS